MSGQDATLGTAPTGAPGGARAGVPARATGSESGSASEPVLISQRDWRRFSSVLCLVSVAALTAVVLGELDRLISSVPAGDGRSHSLNVVLSPVALSKTGSWIEWAGASIHAQLGAWIIASAVLDFLLALTLFLLLARVVRLVPHEHRSVPSVVLLVYGAAEFVENVQQIVGGAAVAAGMPAFAGWIGWGVAAASTVKCLALLLFLVAMLRIGAYRHELGRRIALVAQAVWVHRLATLAIIVIVVLSCIPAADLLDQLPDVQRQWADGGWWHAMWAILALLATAVVTFVLGRRRTRFLVETRAFGLGRRMDFSRWQAAAPWTIAPALLIGALLIATILGLSLGGGEVGVHWPTFLTMTAITGAIPILAAAGYRWVLAHPKPPVALNRDRARASWIVGDSLAALVLVAGAIGIVRSYVVPYALGTQVGDLDERTWGAILIVAVSWAVLAPWILPVLGPRRWKRLDPNARAWAEAKPARPMTRAAYEESRVSRAGRIEWISLIVGLVFLLVAMLVPSQAAGVFGGVAVTLLAITAWVTVFGSFTLIVQSRQLIAPFRWLRLRAAPVLTLGILLPFAVNVIVSSAAPDQTLHAVQVSNPDAASTNARDPLDQRLRELQRDQCRIRTADGIQVRPVYLIAAEGGGIRAAYWTASALATFGRCAARSGFVSSGISGGSVGLAVASTVDDAPRRSRNPQDYKDPADIVRRAKATAGPDVVATAVLGLAVGDVFAAGSGVHMPSYLDAGNHDDDDGWRWRDRAALVEAIWEHEAPGLSTAFSDEIDPLTGMLMLSSTDVVSRCRLLIDQAPIFAPPDDGEKAATAAESGARAATSGGPCDTAGGLPSMLGFRELPASGGSDPTTDCLASLDWSTAAMLSARFAIITPTGGLPAGPPCDGGAAAGDGDGTDVAQFVDGGYVEPTSLAALADTAPRLMRLIAARNADREANQAWLVPMLIYLRNTQGYDLADDVARAESEPLVPITGAAARQALTAEDAWIQRITLAMPGACPDDDAAADCHAALDELIRAGGMLPGGTVVIAPSSTPAVVPPLGWALSNMSEARFTEAIGAAAGCAGSSNAEEVQSASTRHGRYNGLAEFAELIGFNPCPAVAAQERSRGDSG